MYIQRFRGNGSTFRVSAQPNNVFDIKAPVDIIIIVTIIITPAVRASLPFSPGLRSGRIRVFFNSSRASASMPLMAFKEPLNAFNYFHLFFAQLQRRSLASCARVNPSLTRCIFLFSLTPPPLSLS